MSRNILNIVLLSIIFIVFSYSFSYSQKSDYSVTKIVLDPGHGGKDPGAVGKISMEKDLVLDIALKVGELIETNYSDIEVIYTRDTDKFVELHKRAKIANEVEADIFISIHINAISGANAYGAETYAMGLHVSDENLRVAKLENSVVLQEDDYENNYEGFDPSSPESHIIFSLYQDAYLDQSLKLAQNMQHYFNTKAGRYDRGVKQAGFLVLWRTSMPSILVECGFISNPAEEEYMNSEEGKNNLAQSIYQAFEDYKTDLETQQKEIDINYDNTDDTIKEQATVVENDNTEIDYTTGDSVKDKLPDNVFFGVQIKSSSNKLSIDEKIYNFEKDVYLYFHGGSYKYFVGSTINYDEILKLQNDLRKYYKDCFVIALKDGERISLSQAHKELE